MFFFGVFGVGDKMRELSAAELAIRTLEAYAGTDAAFPSLEEFSWVSGGNHTATYHGEDFNPAE